MSEKTSYKLKIFGKMEELIPYKETYLHPRSLCVQLDDKEGFPFARLTVNLCSKKQSFSRAYVDTNNCPWAETFLTATEIAFPVKDEVAKSGYCSYPLYEFDLSKLYKRAE